MKQSSLWSFLIVIIIVIIIGGVIIIIIRIPRPPIPDPRTINLVKIIGIAEALLGVISLGVINKLRRQQG